MNLPPHAAASCSELSSTRRFGPGDDDDDDETPIGDPEDDDEYEDEDDDDEDDTLWTRTSAKGSPVSPKGLAARESAPQREARRAKHPGASGP
jgi:hypothetical protein